MAIKTPPPYLYPVHIHFLLRGGNNMAYSQWCSTDTKAPRTMTCDPIFAASRREIGQICGRMTVRHDNDCMRQRKVYGYCVKAGRRILNAEGRIRQHVSSPRGICAVQSGNGTCFSRVLRFLPASVIPPIIHTHTSFTYHQRYIFAEDGVSFQRYKWCWWLFKMAINC
jgi:hypothetical protein